MATINNMDYCKKSPCNDCPYRKDAPKRLWSIEEFRDLLKNEIIDAEAGKLGVTYGCHKKDGNVCVGWLMDQVKNELPSLALRIALNVRNVPNDYLESLTCKSEMFESVDVMCLSNYPSLLPEVKEFIKARAKGIYFISLDGMYALVKGHGFTIGDEVPFINTRSNEDIAIITKFKYVDNGKIWFYGVNKRTQKEIYYALHCSLDLIIKNSKQNAV